MNRARFLVFGILILVILIIGAVYLVTRLSNPITVSTQSEILGYSVKTSSNFSEKLSENKYNFDLSKYNIQIKLVNTPQSKFKTIWQDEKDPSQKVELISSDSKIEDQKIEITIYMNTTDKNIIDEEATGKLNRNLQLTYEVIRNLCSLSLATPSIVARENNCMKINWEDKIEEYMNKPLVEVNLP